ncbi:hypothetical protein LY78DRAFT_86900 [Colletotrichum sublineola]|nr:hypothetical protein LY78DRAFT_86900 [Colletotrichum sublineola]
MYTYSTPNASARLSATPSARSSYFGPPGFAASYRENLWSIIIPRCVNQSLAQKPSRPTPGKRHPGARSVDALGGAGPLPAKPKRLPRAASYYASAGCHLGDVHELFSVSRRLPMDPVTRKFTRHHGASLPSPIVYHVRRR